MATRQRDFVTVINESPGDGIQLTSLLFQPGGNVYVLTYQKDGRKRHTFIDAGDDRYGDEIRDILLENNIDPKAIERIIITHRHPDHTGLISVLAGESGAKITAHHEFRSYIEGGSNQMENRWSGDFKPSHLREFNFEYLGAPDVSGTIKLGGIEFPNMSETIDIGASGRLNIVGTPKTRSTHSPDQLVVLYSPHGEPHPHMEPVDGFRPTDDIIFSGDLWLMRGPMFNMTSNDIMRNLRAGLHQVGSMLSGGGFMHRDPREQDAEAKDALKRGFCLIRVKPGHGDEFLGSRIIPRSLMADNDILVEFGYPLSAGKELLFTKELAPRVSARREQAYLDFTQEIIRWLNLGYKPLEISRLLERIYREQRGGGPLVEIDRQQRREQLRNQLNRLKEDVNQTAGIRQLASTTLSLLPG